MLKTCSRPGAEKSGESVEEISTPGNLSRISRNPGKSETYRITDRPLKKAEAMGQEGGGVRGGRGGLHLNCQQRAAQVTFTLTNSPTVPALPYTAPNTLILCHALMYCTGLLTAFCNSRSRAAVNSLACKRVISGVPHRLRQHFFAVTFIFCA